MKRTNDNGVIFSVIIIMILFSLFSCRTKSTTTTVTKTDTILKTKVIKITNPQLNERVIESVCDSLGNLIPISYVNSSNKVKTSLKSDKNTLKLEVNIDSLKQEWMKEYKSKENIKEVERIVEVKHIPKWAWYVLIYAILLTAWTFRKPLLKLII